jgi:hypothetical protein
VSKNGQGIAVSIYDGRAYSWAVPGLQGFVPLLRLFNRSTGRRRHTRNVQSFLMWILSPWFRYKLKKLERFAGKESYAEQMKRERLIQTLEACLMYS